MSLNFEQWSVSGIILVTGKITNFFKEPFSGKIVELNADLLEKEIQLYSEMA